MPLELQISELTTTLKDAIEALKENTAVTRQLLSGSAGPEDGVPAFAKAAKQEVVAKTVAAAVNEGLVPASAAQEPKKRGPKPKTVAPEPSVYDKLCQVVMQLVDGNQTDKLIKVFDQFGVKKASQLAPEQHQEAYDLLEAELNGGAETASFV